MSRRFNSRCDQWFLGEDPWWNVAWCGGRSTPAQWRCQSWNILQELTTCRVRGDLDQPTRLWVEQRIGYALSWSTASWSEYSPSEGTLLLMTKVHMQVLQVPMVRRDRPSYSHEWLQRLSAHNPNRHSAIVHSTSTFACGGCLLSQINFNWTFRIVETALNALHQYRWKGEPNALSSQSLQGKSQSVVYIVSHTLCLWWRASLMNSSILGSHLPYLSR